MTADTRRPLFRNFIVGRMVVTEMRSLHDSAAVSSIAWVIMPDHVHWLFQLGDGPSLSGVIKRLEARSAVRINGMLNHRGSIWQRGLYDHAIRHEEDLRAVARYIVANPLRAGLVQHIGDYPLWDAIWL
jgi:putative transposase